MNTDQNAPQQRESSGFTFSPSYTQLKRVASDLLKSIPEETSLESLDAGVKCFNLHFLGMNDCPAHEEAGARALLQIVCRESMKQEARILVHQRQERTKSTMERA